MLLGLVGGAPVKFDFVHSFVTLLVSNFFAKRNCIGFVRCPAGLAKKTVPKMAACVENAMQDLALAAVDAGAAPETAKAVVPEQPGTPDAAQTAPEEPNGTADKAKKQRRRRGTKKPTGKENIPPAGPVDVAAVLKARAAAKKKGKPVSAAAQAALANAKARPIQKKKAPKGRVVADPGCNGY